MRLVYHNVADKLIHFACNTLLDGTVQRCLDVGTRSQQASLGHAAEKWSNSCITARGQQISLVQAKV